MTLTFFVADWMLNREVVAVVSIATGWQFASTVPNFYILSSVVERK